MAAPTSKVLSETCSNCGHVVDFDATKIHRENPYWPWIEREHVDKMVETSAELARVTRSLVDTIRTPGTGLIAQLGRLVDCFDRLLTPTPVPAPASVTEGTPE